MFGSTGPSLADIAAVTGGNGRNSDSGWGDGGWWVLIILFALFGGWGRGYGNNGGGSDGGSTLDSAIQRGFDNQSVINKLNGLENGLCSLGYDQMAQMNSLGMNLMQSSNSLQAQLANCCCENREAIAQVRYDMATDTCAITNAINSAANAIIQNNNDQFCQLKIEAKDEKIAEQASLIQSLNLAQSQANQNQYLISQLRPQPVPAYTVANPYASVYGFGCCNQTL